MEDAVFIKKLFAAYVQLNLFAVHVKVAQNCKSIISQYKRKIKGNYRNIPTSRSKMIKWVCNSEIFLVILLVFELE